MLNFKFSYLNLFIFLQNLKIKKNLIWHIKFLLYKGLKGNKFHVYGTLLESPPPSKKVT